jgi:hypothetical protein
VRSPVASTAFIPNLAPRLLTKVDHTALLMESIAVFTESNLPESAMLSRPNSLTFYAV